MQIAEHRNQDLFPLTLLPGSVAQSVHDLALAVTASSSAQAQNARLQDSEIFSDFLMSCDALNYWRLRWRLEIEYPGFDLREIDAELSAAICGIRGYNDDDFESAKAATEHRIRAPFGLDPLGLAYKQAQRRPIRLLSPELVKSEVATAIAGIARELQEKAGPDRTILLPIEQLRLLLQKRKTVVSGSVLRLTNAGLIQVINPTYHTRKAREYKFVGVKHKHFEDDVRE